MPKERMEEKRCLAMSPSRLAMARIKPPRRRDDPVADTALEIKPRAERPNVAKGFATYSDTVVDRQPFAD